MINFKLVTAATRQTGWNTKSSGKNMRKIIDMQMKIGETAIANIKFDLRSRDEVTKLLIGLQAIYCNRDVREQVFHALMKLIPSDIDINNGRNGMDLCKILVLGSLRLNCNWDYDKLQEIVNNHKTIRQMLGHGLMDNDVTYPLQTLKDNVQLLILQRRFCYKTS